MWESEPRSHEQDAAGCRSSDGAGGGGWSGTSGCGGPTPSARATAALRQNSRLVVVRRRSRFRHRNPSHYHFELEPQPNLRNTHSSGALSCYNTLSSDTVDHISHLFLIRNIKTDKLMSPCGTWEHEMKFHLHRRCLHFAVFISNSKRFPT